MQPRRSPDPAASGVRRRSPRGGASWFERPAQEPGPAATAVRALERLVQETLRLESLAHDLAEYQAARLLRMSADEHLASARRLAALTPSPERELP